jgi:uncharacterized protein involved in exopolysaccharide biosynthesis/Mrp family chromosome partitioning ATPase
MTSGGEPTSGRRGGDGRTEDDGIDLDGLLRVLWRRRRLVAGLPVALMAACLLVLFHLAPLYGGQVLIRLNDRHARVVAVPEVVSELTMDGPTIQSEVEVLRSRALAAAVVRAERLVEDAEFNPALAPPSPLDRLAALLGLEAPADPAPAEARTVEAFGKALTVSSVNQSWVIAVTVASTEAEKAARLAETTARLYIDRQIEAKYAATRAADQWLAGRIAETRLQVAAAEEAVAAYRAAHGLGQATDGPLAIQQRAEVNSRLVAARAERAAAEARLARLDAAAASGRLDTAPEVLASPLVQRLREQEAELRRRVADLSSRYGEKHPRMIDARAELAGLTAQITGEAEKLAAGLRNEARVAAAREASLETDLAGLEDRRTEEGAATLGLRELERKAESLAALHQTFLNRYAETTHRLGLHEADAAILSHATVPQRPSWPRKGLTLAVAGVLGLFAALALAYVLERLDRRLRRPEEVEHRLGTPCLGQVPRQSPMDRAAWMMGGAVEEDMRSLRMAISLTGPAAAAGPTVVCVTSSRPGEGKSTLCLWLAATAAAGRRVVLVDADLRRPRLAALTGGTAAGGPDLADLLAGGASLDDTLRPGPVAGLSVLPGRALGAAAADRLAAPAFQEMLDALRDRFDLIVVDTPPVLPVADARLVTPYADVVLYAVQWEATPWPVAAEGVARLREGTAPEPYAVLTQVDMRKQNSYGYGGSAGAYAAYAAYYGA